MSRSAKAEAALTLHRFGKGPRPGSIAAIETDPRGALIAELDRPAISELAAANLPSSAKAFRAVTDAYARRQAKAVVAKKEQDAKRQQMAEASAMTEGAAQGTGEMAARMAAEAIPDPGRPIYLEEARVRIQTALGADLLKEVKIKKYFIPGEHDWYLDMGATWNKTFGAAPWKFDHKGVFFNFIATH